MRVLWASNVLDELAQFFAQRCENLVFILDRLYMVTLACGNSRGGSASLTVQEWYELFSCAFSAERKSNGIEAMDGIQAQNDIVMLQFIDKNRNWVELVILIRIHGGYGVAGNGGSSRLLSGKGWDW